MICYTMMIAYCIEEANKVQEYGLKEEQHLRYLSRNRIQEIAEMLFNFFGTKLDPDDGYWDQVAGPYIHIMHIKKTIKNYGRKRYK